MSSTTADTSIRNLRVEIARAFGLGRRGCRRYHGGFRDEDGTLRLRYRAVRDQTPAANTLTRSN